MYKRQILIYGEIDMAVAQDVTRRLLVMDAESQDDIRICLLYTSRCV